MTIQQTTYIRLTIFVRIMELVEQLKTSYDNAEKLQSKISQDIIDIEGMSGLKTRHFYNNLLSYPGSRYLEVGPWKGSSVCSAMYQNEAMVRCVDNWSYCGCDDGPKNEFLNNFTKFKGSNNAQFKEGDCFSMNLATFPQNFNKYLYDGDHSYDSHYKALEYYYPILNDNFVYICNNWNISIVRNATQQAIYDLNLHVLYNNEQFVIDENQHTSISQAKKTWWNGIYYSVLQKC